MAEWQCITAGSSIATVQGGSFSEANMGIPQRYVSSISKVQGESYGRSCCSIQPACLPGTDGFPSREGELAANPGLCSLVCGVCLVSLFPVLLFQPGLCQDVYGRAVWVLEREVQVVWGLLIVVFFCLPCTFHTPQWILHS